MKDGRRINRNGYIPALYGQWLVILTQSKEYFNTCKENHQGIKNFRKNTSVEGR